MKTGCEDQAQIRRSSKFSVPAPILAPRIRASKTSRWRAAALILLNLLMIAHVVQWRITGKTVSPIEPSETMQTLQSGAVNAGFIFFSVAILATLVFGRYVCGWGCHILALQDFCAWLLQKIGLHPKPFRSRLLVYVPLIAALYMFVWPTAYRFLFSPEPGPVIPSFTNHLVTENFWATFPSVAVAIPFLAICGFLTVYFLGMKGFCTYACPYGGFFGLADKLSPFRIRVTDACNQCGHCTATCTSNVLVHAEVKEYKMVVDPGCMKCMDCVSVCPNDALYVGWGKPAVAVPKSDKIPRRYSLTWPEEILGALTFFGSFMAVRGVYGLVPFLMALGYAAVTTFLTLTIWKLATRESLSFYRFDLKSLGKIKSAGLVFLSFAIIWIVLCLHSGWVRWQEHQGDQAFQRLQVPDELALAQADPAPWLSPEDRQNAEAGQRALTAAADYGLFVNADALAKLAWFDYLRGNAALSVERLRKAADYQKDQAKALSLYYHGTILNRLGRYEQARTSLDEALKERPDLLLARQERGESLWQLGNKEQAAAAWADAVQLNGRLSLAGNFLAGAERALGQTEDAIAHEKQADQFTPDIPAYHWMLGLRLQTVGMNELAQKHFQRAAQLDPRFQARPN
jgi:polyferredoxin/tetratricopeptide (TPR) repeat protein